VQAARARAAGARRARSNARGQASREQILRAAVELLQERGYSGLSIAAICERADIAPTSLYWHFGSKAGLMEAVIARTSSGYAERIRASAARGRTRLERLDLLIAGIRELVTTQPLGSLTGVAVVGEGRHVTPELRQALQRAREREFAAITTDLEAELGGSPRAAETLAIVALACTNYAALSHRMQPDDVEVDRILAGLRDAFLRIAGAEGDAG